MRTTAFEIRGIHVLLGLLGFFAAIIAINVAFAVAAVRTFPGEDERRAYTQGLRYNDVLAERRAQADLGWQARTELLPSSAGARLIVHLSDRQGEPIDHAALEGVLRWAPNESGDRSLQFTPIGGGGYVAELGALQHGRWDLRANARDESDHRLDFTADLRWPTP